MRFFQVSSGEGIKLVEAMVVCCGKDINMCIVGGDTFHIGASSLAVPRPSLKRNNEISASASVICVTSHKEDQIAREASLRFAATFNARVCVSCGLHIDDATDNDISELYSNFLQVLDKIEEDLLKMLSDTVG